MGHAAAGQTPADRDALEASAAATGALVAWAAGLAQEDISVATLRRAALVLCDDIGAIIAAREEPEVVRLQDQLLANPGLLEATVLRGGRPMTDRYSAAVANGVAADWCELDEGYRKATCHAGLYTLPALLAEAEAEGLKLSEVLRALVIGYEVVTRFARGFVFDGLVLHPHASLSAIGAAAAVAAARRLPEKQFLDAVTGAATMVSPGPYNHAVAGALVRNVWAANGAWTGMRCVDWAGCGIGGLAASPYHVFVEGFGADSVPEALTAGLGAEWAIEDGYHKMHACCQYAHSAVDAVGELAGAGPEIDAAADLEAIVVETHWRGLSLDNREPATSLAAKFSMPHIVAAASVMGHAGAEAFSAESLGHPAIAALRQRVELKPFAPERPWPNDRPARVTWRFKSGETRQAECLSARGGPDRPFSREEILAKIGGIAAPVYPAMAQVAEALTALDPELLGAGWDDLIARMTAG